MAYLLALPCCPALCNGRLPSLPSPKKTNNAVTCKNDKLFFNVTQPNQEWGRMNKITPTRINHT
jgi:hypothetical protein